LVREKRPTVRLGIKNAMGNSRNRDTKSPTERVGDYREEINGGKKANQKKRDA